jgi:FAD/FMN-containing dehydrogenase
MNRVRAIDPVNNTITVEAGCVLAQVQRAAEGSCTIGGNLSTNAGGTAVLRFGNARELVLGIEVVLADGRVWNGLRGLRKDNTGYDLKQMFIGAEGTLGVVTAAVLKLFPAPRSRVTAFVATPDVAASVRLLRELRQTLGDRITGFELMSALSIAISRKHHPALPNPCPGHPWYALIQVDDCATDSPIEAQLEQALGAAMESGVALDATIAQSGEQAALIRIENKTYGICRETGKLISKERLRAVPHATLSIDAKQKQR